MKRYRLRIIVPIMLVHLLAIPILVYQFLLHFEEPIWDTQKSLGQSILREVRDRIALNQITSQGDPHQVQRTVDELYTTYGFRSLRVYNQNKILRAYKGEFMVKTPYPENGTIITFASSGDLMEITQWVKNEEACHSCHGSSAQHIGVIEASIPVSQIVKRLGSQRWNAMIITLSLLIVVFSLIYLFHRHFIVDPVKSIMRAMLKVKEGDLSVQVPAKRGDELGSIAESFNEVVRSLRDAKMELEKRHQADMTRAEQLATVGEVAAGLAHEVKNPLAGISSALEVILSETEENWQHREVLGQVIEETHRIASTINRLLDYARPREAKPDWCDVQMVVGDIRSIFTPQCQKEKVDFLVDAGDNLGRMFVDSQELKQVLINILLNALEAVNSHGRIEFSVTSNDESVTFEVADNGIGMNGTTRAKIFQPFYTTKPGGTGLGLAIVDRLIRDMGGILRVESHLGEGTRFHIQVPREHSFENTNR